MTKEQAIKQIEIFQRSERLGGAIQTALDMAIAALREQDNRTESDTVKGCKLCNSTRFDIAAQTRDPDDMYVFSSDPVIGAMFCPLCGRRLEEA